MRKGEGLIHARNHRHSQQEARGSLLIDALKRLTYLGYDSAGIATLVNGHIDRRRAEGKITRDLWCLASTRRS
jgi:glucosamine 6-phosphate synthetase-like amidotransferase/phosphosugar isomerase protein